MCNPNSLQLLSNYRLLFAIPFFLGRVVRLIPIEGVGPVRRFKRQDKKTPKGVMPVVAGLLNRCELIECCVHTRRSTVKKQESSPISD